MRKSRKILLGLIGTLAAIPVLIFIVGACLYYSSDYLEPRVSVDLGKYPLSCKGHTLRTCGDNSLVLNKYGLWEAKLSGGPIDRGAAYGLMSKELLEYQEKVFVDQIHRMIPSESWVNFLHKLIGIFNRDMASHIPREYREEIYAMSLSASHMYDSYGTPYIRQLNYHAAHDIGHALQEFMLVGCSSFAAWGEQSENNQLIVGRNFDFYVGEAFAENRIVLFVAPQAGYRFVSITWPGMMGVLSGMNEKGLTVTINAAKGAVPMKSARPISLLTREILQYASTIEEAYEIASRCETFVSESILIGSAKDGRAAVIEKSPDRTALYNPPGRSLVCTNHYQSEAFGDDEYNKENIATSDSAYRHRRLGELLAQAAPLSVPAAVAILRDRRGLGGADIGLANEKSINQFICHHSVVFSPGELKMWVSTSPWQLGEFVCYDLNEAFRSPAGTESAAVESLNIPADAAALRDEYPRVLRHKELGAIIRKAAEEGESLPEGILSEYMDNNPEHFQVYKLAGDYMLSVGNRQEALRLWRLALTREIPRAGIRREIEEKIQQHD